MHMPLLGGTWLIPEYKGQYCVKQRSGGRWQTEKLGKG